MTQPLPITLLSGFAGAGKTTLLSHLVAQSGDTRIAVISGASHDLATDIARIAQENTYDAVVVENPASADPQAVAEALIFDNDIAHIDTLVTVVDAGRFLADYASSEPVHEHDDRTVVEVLIEQIEFCDVIAINKVDLIAPDALARLRRVLHALNPRAEIIETLQGVIDPALVVNADRFDFDATSSAPGWLALMNADEGSPVSDDTGLVEFVYRARRPFHPERLWALMHREWPGVLRCKGFFWLATRSDEGGLLSQAGGALRHGPAGMWWAAQDRSEWPTGDAELEAEIAAEWHGDPSDTSVGDRRQELAMIGIDIDEAQWRAAFDTCLLTDDEWAAGQAAWVSYQDPFPAWEMDDEDDDHDHHDHSHH